MRQVNEGSQFLNDFDLLLAGQDTVLEFNVDLVLHLVILVVVIRKLKGRRVAVWNCKSEGKLVLAFFHQVVVFAGLLADL